jgi:RNA polymerase sigma-70 factor (ECF subfamily)
MQTTRLLARLRAGDTRALERLIGEYSGYVAAVVRHTLGTAVRNEDCEELVSDVFITLWNKAAGLAPESHLKPWLAVVARNKALNWARTRRPEPADTNDVATLVGYAALAEPDTLDSIARNQLIAEALDTLDEESRKLMVGYYLEDRSIGELAQMTGHSQPMIKSRLYRSRKLLQARLQQEGCVG